LELAILNNEETPKQPYLGNVLLIAIIFQSKNQIGNAREADGAVVLRSFPSHSVFGILGAFLPHSKTYPYHFYS